MFNNRLQIMSIENPTLVHFRHFSSLLTIFPLYICRDSSTDVMSALQIQLFMQNKAKFKKVKLNVNKEITRDYDQMDTWSIRKKQSQTNPNKAKQTQTKPNSNSIFTP